MDLRRWTGTSFVKRAPTKSGEDVELRVTALALPHALWWHSHVQPVIDEDSDRTDRGWNWLLYLPFTRLAGGVLRHRPAGYAVGVVVPEPGRFVPCALVQLLGRYPALNDNQQRSSFTWFLTTAPVGAMVSIPDYHLSEDRVPKRLGTIALDVAVTHSLNHRGQGRVGLHADEDGGDGLLQWYQRQGMQVLPRDERLPRGPRRLVKPSDGRYCYFTARAAVGFSRELDSLR